MDGSFTGAGQYRDQGEYTPKDQAPDPVLAQAFGRTPGESLQRHPTDAGALDAERDDSADDFDDPWRNPGAAAGLGTPAFVPTAQAAPTEVPGKLGVRDVIFGRRVSFTALAVLGIVALVLAGLVVILFLVGATRDREIVLQPIVRTPLTLSSSGVSR